MREYVTEAIVLDKEAIGEADQRVFLFTRRLGVVAAKVTSGRKITSKLSPHLEPLSISTVRLIEKNGFHVTDALASGKLPYRFLEHVKLIREIFFEGESDRGLWDLLKNGNPSVAEVLSIAGYDASSARCERCSSLELAFFMPGDMTYLCKKCMPVSLPQRRYVNLGA